MIIAFIGIDKLPTVQSFYCLMPVFFLLQIQNIQLEREMALASNRSLAEQNLDMKPRLESQKELLVERYSQLEAVRETYRKHSSLRGGAHKRGLCQCT